MKTIPDMKPEQIFDYYLRRMHCLEKEQFIRLIQLHTQIKRKDVEYIFQTNMSRGLIYPATNSPSCVAIAPGMEAEESTIKSFWVFLSFLATEQGDIKIIGLNNWNGIDFDRAGETTSIVYLANQGASVMKSVIREDDKDTTYVFLLSNPIDIVKYQTVTPQDCFALLTYKENYTSPVVEFLDPPNTAEE